MNFILRLALPVQRGRLCAIAGSLFALTLLNTGCTKSRSTPEPALTVQLHNSASLGTYLTDIDGRTLYYFANDATKASSCAGGCAAVWPPYNAGALTADLIDPSLDIADFDQISGPSGTQTTYKGRPLYYYAPSVSGTNVRELAGETEGENVNGVWFVAKPDYTIMLTNAQLVGHDGKHYLSDYTEGDGKTIYFTDEEGITLYVFVKDSMEHNKFTKPDFSNNTVWPIYEEDKIVVPSALDASLFSVIDVYGKKQMTYKGWPLYYFGQDNKEMGSNKGVSFPVPGIWPVPTKNMDPAPAP